MPEQTKDVLKSYFNDGDVPLETHYVDLIDSMITAGTIPHFLCPSLYLSLPGIRSYYPFGVNTKLTSTVLATDLANKFHLTDASGTSLLSIYNDTVPYANLDGSTDYFYYPDDAHFEISGTETYINSTFRGLTIGAWVRLTGLPSIFGTMGVVSKWYQSANCAYRLFLSSSNKPSFGISEDGTVNIGKYQTLAHTTSVTSGSWLFVVGQYSKYSNKLCITLNGDTVEAATSLTGIYVAGIAALEVGRHNQISTDCLYGDMSNVFISCMYLSREIISSLFNRTKSLYGISPA